MIFVKIIKCFSRKTQCNCVLIKVLLDFLCAPPRKGGGRRPFLQSKNALTIKIAGFGTESQGLEVLKKGADKSTPVIFPINI